MRVVSAGRNCLAHHLLAIESEGDKNVKIPNLQPAVWPAALPLEDAESRAMAGKAGTNREATTRKLSS